MAHSIREIAVALGATAEGNLDLTIERASEPSTAEADDLALAMDPRYSDGIAKGKARAALIWPGADWRAFGLEAAIFAPRGRLAMAGLSVLLDKGPEIAAGIHPLAVVDPSAKIGIGAAVGPFVVIGANVVIGARAKIASHVSIAASAVIGDDAVILQGARIGASVSIGHRLICHAGAVLGSDGFSFVTPEKSGVEEIRATLGKRAEITQQSWTRIHSLGAVEIGDDVEIGANVAIDRGTIRNTVIGSGTKLDNLVHVGHNVQIGKDCLLCAQVGIAGSSRLGDRVVLAGQCGVNDNIFIADDVICGGASKVFTNVPAGRVMLGYPAVKMETHIDLQKALRRLPRLAARVAEMEKTLSRCPEAK